MIRLDRTRTAAAVAAEYRGGRRIEQEAKLLKAFRDEGLDLKFNKEFWKRAKKQLKEESAGKCAYCEAETSVVAHGDVEHFRPKSVYWWLAYCYENYLYSCQLCNQTYKKANFPFYGTPFPEPDIRDTDTDDQLDAVAGSCTPDPFDGDDRYTLAMFRADGDAEEAGLPDPYNMDPEPLFKWEVDEINKTVAIASRDNTPPCRRAFEAARDFLGLNRPDLLKERWKTYFNLNVIRAAFERFDELGDPVADQMAEGIQEMKASDAPFAGMVRFFVDEVWKLDLDD